MRWLKKFKNLWSIENVKQSSDDELEEDNKKSLEKKYLDKQEIALNEAYSILEEDETVLEDSLIEPSKEYDAGDVNVEELLHNKPLESHYELNIIDAELDGSDEHLINVEKIEP